MEQNNWDSAWPRIGAQRQRQKTLAWLDVASGRLVTEHGKIRQVQSLEDCSKLEGMDVYVESLTSLCWYPDIIAHGSVACNDSGCVIGARVKGRRGYVYLCYADRWIKRYTGYYFICWLRKLFEYCGAGDYLSPASLGHALWEQCYLEEGFRRQRKPNRALLADLEAGMIGGRVDFMADKEKTYALAHEIDMNNAYATAARMLPEGTPLYFPDDTIESLEALLSYPVAYARCYVTLTEPIPIGVVPVRGEYGENTRYITETGGTSAWLWTDEIKAAIRAGYMVTPICAWAWEGSSSFSEYWVNRMVWLRENVPDKEMAQVIKQAIVGAIGKAGSVGKAYELTLEETDIPVLEGSEPSDYYVKEKVDFKKRGMKHWHSFIMARVRVWLFERMVAEMKAGNTILATNYDAIYITGAPRVTVDKLWKHSELHDTRFPYPRAVIAREKRRLPGIKQTAIGA